MNTIVLTLYLKTFPDELANSKEKKEENLMTETSVEQRTVTYNRASTWQMAFFVLNNTATNLYMFMMGFVTYYATGIAGLMVMAVSTIMTTMRIWDGITDPMIGYIIDRTDSKLGKFRPFMILGNIILAITTITIFQVTHRLPESMRLYFFIGVYAIYIIGYTFQTAVTKSGQTVLTNDPEQRPMFSMFDAIYNALVFTGGQIMVASYLVPKHGGFTMGLFNELLTYGIILSAVFTILAVLGIWSKDRTEFFGVGNGQQLRIRDYWPIIKNNRALQMLVVSASTDKLAGTIMQNSVVGVMLYGILMGNYELSGKMGMITLVPTVIVTVIGVRFASKFGSKRAMVGSTWLAMANYTLLFGFFLFADLTTISLANLNLATILFIVLMVLGGGFRQVAGNIVIPMIADCSDYETYRTGNYVPGLMGTIFSFVDKLISSLGATIVGVAVALIGYKEQFPQIGDSATSGIFWVTMFLFIGAPMIGWICNIIAMKFYPLDDEMMEKIQMDIQARRLEN